jgi:hypothetical protein
MGYDKTIDLPGSGKLARRQMFRALVGIGMVASLLMSCQSDTGGGRTAEDAQRVPGRSGASLRQHSC